MSMVFKSTQSPRRKLPNVYLHTLLTGPPLWEAKVLVERWRREYNQIRPHSALAYRPPAPEAKLPRSQELGSIPWGGLQMAPGLT